MKNRGINRRFQSTLPLRGATSCDNGLCKSFLISIHAPHERSDVIYDNSILSVTKIDYLLQNRGMSFTITQFFQLLKLMSLLRHSRLSFTITQFFQLLKFISIYFILTLSFTITQFFQLLKCQICKITFLNICTFLFCIDPSFQ